MSFAYRQGTGTKITKLKRGSYARQSAISGRDRSAGLYARAGRIRTQYPEGAGDPRVRADHADPRVGAALVRRGLDQHDPRLLRMQGDRDAAGPVGAVAQLEDAGTAVTTVLHGSPMPRIS